MTAENRHYLSKEKYRELEAELKYLKTVRRKEIAESLEFAKSLGDLSENAEYQEAREEQAKVEDRIGTIELLMKDVQIVEGHHSIVAELGSVVVVQKENEKNQQRYHIVGSEEANIKENKISNESPLGKAIQGKRKGDVFGVATPRGQITYTLVNVE
jgi:transcription elongation factor GreA